MSIGIWKQQTQQVKKITEGGNIISLTRAEYEALETKNPNILYVITDDEQGAQEGVYSQSETICGTWIDGKPIYRKLITATNNVSSSSWGAVCNDDLSFIKRIIRAEQSREDYFLNPLAHRRADGKLYAFSAGGTSIGDLFILEYTKTTD